MIRQVCLLSLLVTAAAADELWIDQEQGDDQNSGSQVAPMATVAAAHSRLKAGDTLHFVPGEKPWPNGIRITASGTAEAPIVIDGHGSVVSGRRRLPVSEWKEMDGGVYSRPMPNNAWGMQTKWEGGFPLVWINGEEAKLAATRDELSPGEYFLYKNQTKLKTDPLHNTLYVRLPEGVSIDQIESITGEGGIYVGGDFVIVRNFVTEYGGRDGYATHRNKGVVFEKIEARYFMDQGMSHHGAEVVVRNAHFHHNAGCGIVDVYPEAKVRYENCLIENDTWRGGVEFHSGEFEMIDCTIRGNPKSALSVAKGARVNLENCELVGKETTVNLGKGSHLKMTSCKVRSDGVAISARFQNDAKLSLGKCEISGKTAFRIDVRGEIQPDALQISDTNHEGEIEVIRMIQDSTGTWKKTDEELGQIWHVLGK